jgi:hypothetical protein
VLENERPMIFTEAHDDIAEENYVKKTTTKNILCTGLLWPTLHKYAKEYWQSCDVCQRVGNPTSRDEIPLHPHVILQVFNKWAKDFWGPINPQERILGVRYIITVMKYLKIWVETTPVLDCTLENVVEFLFENVLTRFGCPCILISGQGTHFLNKTITTLTEEFQIHQHKSTPYHPYANGTIESFNKILENALTKICNVGRDYWDLRFLVVLWASRTKSKNLTRQTPFRWVHEQEAVMPMDFILPIIHIVVITDLLESGAIEERLSQLVRLEEDRFFACFHQQVQKEIEKVWHDRHIKQKKLQVGDLVLLYDSKFMQIHRSFKCIGLDHI